MTIEYSIKSSNILYVNDKVILDNLENNIERGIYTLQNIAEDFGIKIQKQKNKTQMAFLGQDTKRNKIIINKKWLEQVSIFNYLGWDIFYKG